MTLQELFESIKDERIERCKKYNLLVIRDSALKKLKFLESSH